MSGMTKKFSENAGYFKAVVLLCCTEKIHAKGDHSWQKENRTAMA